MANTNTLVKATATITSTKNFAGDDTIIVGSRTYTLKASPSAAYEVDLGSTEAITLANFVAAINGTGTSGTTYGADTLPVPGIVAASDGVHVITLTARMPGTHGNSYKNVEGTDGANAYSVAAFSAGTGDLSDFIDDLMDINQINSEVYAELAKLSEDTAD